MLYLPELYYFWDQKDFPSDEAFLFSVLTIGRWCRYFSAEILNPPKGMRDTQRSGELPKDPGDLNKFLKEIVHWLSSNSMIHDDFRLVMDTEHLERNNFEGNEKFSYYEPCCWNIDLTVQQFEELQKALEENGFPRDLFYPQDKEIYVPAKPGFFMKLFKIEAGRSYSPKRWEVEQKKAGKKSK